MKYSSLLGKTTRQKPAGVNAKSHEYLLRGGFIHPVAGGIYDFLPLGYKVLEKIDRIIKEELSKRGVQHLLMPFVHPASLWIETGRFEKWKKVLAVFKAQHGGDYLLAPTHEETVTDIARKFITSYRDLPVIVNQNQWKYRDEIRVSGGLLRTREFLMQDAYSFDLDTAGLDVSFQTMNEVYQAIFKRMGFNITVVNADSGAIGGSGSMEYMILSEIGEDTIFVCDSCDYKANIEKAESLFPVFAQNEEKMPMEKIAGKDITGVSALAKFLHIPVEKTTKTLLYQADGDVVAVCIRGNYIVSETKLKNILGCINLALASEETVKKVTGATKLGYAGPLGLPHTVKVLWDKTTQGRVNFEAGANETDYHNINVNFGKDLAMPEQFYDIRNVVEAEVCASCKKGKLQAKKAIELGHVFKLGTIYSKAMNAKYVDKDGVEKLCVMGCYGIGMTRVIAAAVEQHHDEKGIVWPKELSPFDIHLIQLSGGEEQAKKLYTLLLEHGLDVLWDERDETAGIKFADSDLLGIPIRLVVSKKTGDTVEVKYRNSKEYTLVPTAEIVEYLKK